MFAKSKKINIHLGLWVVVSLARCGGGSISPNLAIALSVLNSAPYISCPNGGITIQSGIDTNGDQILNETEVSTSQFICNGATGAVGTSALSYICNGNSSATAVDGVARTERQPALYLRTSITSESKL
jgi:hypothetical protein